ncbi:MAG: hypothetical protein NVSMB19_20170 [Vulcanimicrobiaceae bacterium]
MNRLSLGAAVIGVVVTATSTIAVAANTTALTKAAADLGFAYSYLGPEDAAALTRPGVTIVIRPGERLFDVNDRTEAMDGPAPRFAYNDIFVSDALVARLRQLAVRYPSAVPSQRASVNVPAPVAATANVTGAIANLHAVQIPGEQQLRVGGDAPATAPIMVTLVGTFSTELPDVVLNRRLVTADSNGTFQTDLPIASGYYRGAILTVVATSVPGVTSARTQLSAKAPNGAVSIPADSEPKSIK